MITDWSVQYTLSDPLSEDELVDMQETFELKGIDASVAAVPSAGHWIASFGIAADGFAQAIGAVQPEFDDFIGPYGQDVIAVTVVTLDELERRADEPTMPVLVGATEVATMLDVSRQRVHQLREHEDFPQPLVDVAMGSLWDERAIEKFNRNWSRKPGRPAAESHA